MITTISQRHRYRLPSGYVCKLHIQELERAIDCALAGPGAVPSPSTYLSGRAPLWELYFTTPPNADLAAIETQIEAVLEAHRKS